jgi:hypothetical protein
VTPGGLRTTGGGGAPDAAGPPAGEERELAVRTARKDGQQIATLRAVQRAEGCVVECEVYPAGALSVDPLTPGPYTFASVPDATRFVDEALQALMYLGCDVA